MNKKVKIFSNYLKIIVCVALITCTFKYGYSYFNSLFRNETDGVSYGDSFHSMPEDSVDIIVLGSSHAQYSFIPSFMYQDTGLYSYVLGSACQPLKVSYEMLKEALKTQNPELVVLEVFTATPLKSTCDGDSCYVMSAYQMRDEERTNTIKMLPEDKQGTYLNDYLINHNNWRTINSLSDFEIEDWIDPCFGYVEQTTSLPVDNWWYPNTYYETEEVELNDEDRDALNNILSLCKDNGIELFLYMMPMEDIDVENQSYRYKVWQWADENEVRYIDFVDIAEELDYRLQIHNDGAHSMVNGSGYITDYLADYFVSNYDFSNHTDNENLDEIYSKYIGIYNIEVLKTEHNPLKYLPRLINYDGTVIMKYLGNDKGLDDEIKQNLSKMGVSEDFNSSEPYYAVFSGGQMVAHDKSELAYEIDGHQIIVNSLGINVDGSVMDDDESSKLTFVVYDEDYGEVATKRINVDSKQVWDLYYDYSYNYVLED